MTKVRESDKLTIELPGDPDPTNRLNMLTSLLEHAENKVNHFDNLRHATLLLTLSIFGGIFSFSVGWGGGGRGALACTSVALIVAIFLVRDRRIHAYSEGWQSTRKDLTRAMKDVLTHPEDDVSFFRYDFNKQKAHLLGRSRWPYLLLIAAALASAIPSKRGCCRAQRHDGEADKRGTNTVPRTKYSSGLNGTVPR